MVAAPVQESIGCKTLCELCQKRGYDFCANAAKTTPITTPPAAPVQEPEHIVHSNGRYSPLLTRMMNKRVESNVKQVIHLYDEPPAAQPSPVQEPVAYPEGDVVGPCVCGSWPGGKCLKCPRITPPAAPVQEPAGWQICIGNSPDWSWADSEAYADFYGKQSGLHYKKRPLYATPPAAHQQWVGLTDEEIKTIDETALTKNMAIAMTMATLKEKNSDL
jgi:hypothetical protein